MGNDNNNRDRDLYPRGIRDLIDRIVKRTEEGDTSFIDALKDYVDLMEQRGWDKSGWHPIQVNAIKAFFRDLEEWIDAGQPG